MAESPAPVTLRPIKAIITDLKQPIKQRHLKTRRQGGAQLTYIEWHVAQQYLDRYAPGWNGEVRSVSISKEHCVVTYRITIPCVEGLVHREATGIEKWETNSFGDPSSNAEAQAFKRACARFGLGLHLYNRAVTSPNKD